MRVPARRPGAPVLARSVDLGPVARRLAAAEAISAATARDSVTGIAPSIAPRRGAMVVSGARAVTAAIVVVSPVAVAAVAVASVVVAAVASVVVAAVAVASVVVTPAAVAAASLTETARRAARTATVRRVTGSTATVRRVTGSMVAVRRVTGSTETATAVHAIGASSARAATVQATGPTATGLVATATATATGGRQGASGPIRASAVAQRASVTPSAAPPAGTVLAGKAAPAGTAAVVRVVRSAPAGQGEMADSPARPDRGRAHRAGVTVSVGASGAVATVAATTGRVGSLVVTREARLRGPAAAARPRAKSCHGSRIAPGRINSRGRRAPS